MNELREAIFNALSDFRLPDEPGRVLVIRHPLDKITGSADFPHILIDTGGEMVANQAQGHLDRGHLRKAKFDVLVVEKKGTTYEAFNTARERTEELLNLVILHLGNKATEIFEAGFSGLTFRESEYGESDNLAVFLAQVSGTECVVGRIALRCEYNWDKGTVQKKRIPALRT